MRWSLGVLAVIGLAGCGMQMDALKPASLSPADITAVHAGLRDTLKDPASAQFDEPHAGLDKDGTMLVCGHVNARNSFGGYTGKQPFVGVLTPKPTQKFTPLMIGSTSSEEFAVRARCQGTNFRA